MTETNVFQLSQPGTFADPLTEVLRNGARAPLSQAVEAEIAALLGCHADKLTDNGRQRLVRHGHLPEREIMTGIGPVAVRCPRVRDRVGEGSERIRFSSAILLPYVRRSKSLEVLIRSSISKASPPATSKKHWSPCSATMPAGFRPRPSEDSKTPGRNEHVRWSKRDLSPSVTSTSGPTASTSRLAWRTKPSACSSSLAPRPRARRSSSASSTACARASNPGGSCSSTPIILFLNTL